jgi:hypothetical protein
MEVGSTYLIAVVPGRCEERGGIGKKMGSTYLLAAVLGVMTAGDS